MITEETASMENLIMPIREKYWRELLLAEQVERLRQVLREERDRHESLRQRFNELESRFYAHGHDPKGIAVIPAVLPEPREYVRSRVSIGRIGTEDEDCFI